MIKSVKVNYKLNNEQIAVLTLDLKVEIDNFAIYSTNDQLKNYVKGILTSCYHTYNWHTYEIIEDMIIAHLEEKYDIYVSI